MSKSFQHLDFIIEHTQKISVYYAGRNMTNRQFFAMGLLQRLNHSCRSLKILLERMPQDISMEFSIGLILRALILDFLIVLNLQRIIKEGIEKKLPIKEVDEMVENYCHEALADGLKQAVGYIKDAKTFGILSEEQIKNTFDSLQSEYTDFFLEQKNKGDAPIGKYKSFPSASALFGKIASHRIFANLAKVYDSYQFFSKYDHFGILYFQVINVSLEQKMHQIANTIELLLGHQGYVCHILTTAAPDDEFIKKQFDLSAEYLKTLKDQ